jgi:hypothetical protein
MDSELTGAPSARRPRSWLRSSAKLTVEVQRCLRAFPANDSLRPAVDRHLRSRRIVSCIARTIQPALAFLNFLSISLVDMERIRALSANHFQYAAETDIIKALCVCDGFARRRAQILRTAAP